MQLGSRLPSFFLLAACPVVVLAVQVRHDVACSRTHLIHIGKTGGTTVRNYYDLLGEKEQKKLIIHRDHHFVLGAGEPGDCYAFFVRDPIERWVSGFLEHLKGYKHWKAARPVPEEYKFTFKNFKTPTELAEAVESTNEGLRAKAFEAIHGLEHTRHTFTYYLPNLTEHLGRILFVGETRNLRKDFETICRRAGFAPPDLSSEGHHNACPDEMEWMKVISSEAHGNLHRLLKEDYKLIETLKSAGLIKSTDLRKRDCVAGQMRCVVTDPKGQYRMVSGALAAEHVDIYRLPNATS